MTTDSPNQTSELPQRYIASELNLSRLPFFASSTKNLKNKDGITYRDTVTHKGKEVKIVWEVTGNTKYGYPGPFAESVHVALLDIITEKGIPFENPVVFSFYDICQRLDIKHNGKNIRSIRNAILSIRLAGIVIENSFVTKDGRRLSFTPDPTFLYKRIALYGDTNQETGTKMNVSAVWLSDFYLQSLNSGNIRPVDFEYFKHLHGRSFAATKIYQYLGYRFSGAFRHDNDYAKVDYDELAIIADVKRQPYLSRAKQKLEKAHQALIETGFVNHIEWEKEKRADGSKKFFIYYYPGDRAQDEYRNGRLTLDRQLELPLLSSTKQSREEEDDDVLEDTLKKIYRSPNTTMPLAHELKALGITADRAQELDQKYSEERILRQLDHLDFLSEKGKSPNDAAAWLVSAIEHNYSTPDGFKTREERQAEKKAREKAAQRKKQQEKEEERRQQQKESRRRELDEKLSALPEARQKAITEEIVERIKADNPDLMRNIYQTKPLDPTSPMHQAEYYEHLADLLDEEKASD